MEDKMRQTENKMAAEIEELLDTEDAAVIDDFEKQMEEKMKNAEDKMSKELDDAADHEKDQTKDTQTQQKSSEDKASA